MDQPKIERMLRLMKMMSDNVNYTINEMAADLGISYRSVYRYIDTFEQSGFVVEKIRSNVYKLGKMPKSFVDFNKLIYFTEEEAYIVNRMIQSLSNSNAFKSNLQKKLSAIYQSTSIANYTEDHGAAENIEALGQAIKEKKRVVLIGYESANSNKISDRFIEPFQFTTNFVDVWGFDITSGQNKVFKISRIQDVVILDEEWQNEKQHQSSKTDCFRMSGFEGIPVKLEMSITAKNLLIEEYPLSEKFISKSKDKWILKTEVYSLAGVGRFVAGLADHVKVLDSPELMEYLIEFNRKYMKAYE